MKRFLAPVIVFLFVVSGCTTQTQNNSSLMELVEIGRGYEGIKNLKDIDGKIAFLATNESYDPEVPWPPPGGAASRAISGMKDPRQWFIVYDGQVIGKQYTTIFDFIEVNGKIAYVVGITPYYPTFVVYDGIEGKKYQDIKDIKEINGTLAYFAQNNSKWFLVYNGVEGKSYHEVKNLVEINGKPAYFANNSSVYEHPEWILVYDGNESQDKYYNVDSLIGGGGKVAFQVVSGYPGRKYILYDGKEVGKEYEDAWNPVEVNGTLAYLASDGNKTFIVYNGEEIGKQYGDISGLFEINGKLAYIIGYCWYEENFIVYDNQEIRNYRVVGDPFEVNGKLTFRICKKEGTSTIYTSSYVYGDKVIGNEYGAGNLIGINGKLAFIARKDGKSFVVMEK